ncbi:MAG TPA: extracellular solute-binding protein [Trebonia sp.]|jgi:multiple sugar transport system substrate-binding protein|nr:extracellular solute-binding protein [Trebonia sp.]
MRSKIAIAALAAAGLAVLSACSSSNGFGSSSASSTASGAASATANKSTLTLMFGSSGPAETAAVQQAAKAFTKQSGIPVQVIAASNLSQQVAQGFSGGTPPDVFYLDPLTFQSYAKDGVLDAYPSSLPNASGFASALTQAFTYKSTFTCEPKDASTLALYINTTDWQQAGLGAPPANWSQLEADAKKLTTGGRAGLTIDQTHSGIDEFFYQNGGTVTNAAGTKVDLNSSQNVAALTFLKGMLNQGIMKFPAQVGAGFSGQAFGENKAAMDIIGNWENGELQSDYPNVKFKVYPLPAGPTGTHATLSFTNCWGVPKQQSNLAGALDFVKFLTTSQQEMTFSKAFGVIPSLTTAQTQYETTYPQYATFVQELAYAHPDIAIAGATQALSAFDSALEQLSSGDPASILKTAQQNLQAVLNQDS